MNKYEGNIYNSNTANKEGLVTFGTCLIDICGANNSECFVNGCKSNNVSCDWIHGCYEKGDF